MKARCATLALAVLAAILVTLLPGAAHGDTAPQHFSGSFSPTACGAATDFNVSGAGETIIVTVSADVPANDIAVNLLHGGGVVANTDTGVGQEVLLYKTGEGGVYSVQVCPSGAPAGPFTAPYTYDGLFSSSSEAPVPIPPGSLGGSNGIKPVASHSSWNAVFGPSTIVDAQRTEGEPLAFLEPDGTWWESGPWGTSTQNSFVHRSTDGGKSFHVVSPIQLRPDAGPGGGDTDVVVDDQGNTYFVDLEALVNLGTSVSSDDGNTWRKNPAAVQNSAVDRQWYAVDNGTTPGADDNTVFLAFHEAAVGTFIYSSPGSTGPADPVGGLVWQSASATGPVPLAADAICAQLRFDDVTRNLYYACNEGDHVRVTVGHARPGQRTGIAFVNYRGPKSPGGKLLNLFPAVATDRAGNVYIAWIDGANFHLYYAFSTDQGRKWSAPVKVNAGPAVTNEFDWAQGGSAGTLALAWYATRKTAQGGSDGMPNYLDDPTGAAAFPWFGYAALITAANTATPDIAQARFTEKPMHYGQICNSGINCTLTGGDRQMADFFGFALGPDGGLRIVYNDTSNDQDGAGLQAARQLAGTTPIGTTLGGTPARDEVSDATGDAEWPHYGVPGANVPQLDLTKVRVTAKGGQLQVTMTLSSLASLAPPPGRTSAVWLTRFQTLAPQTGGTADVFPIFYVGAQSTAGTAPSFFAGTVECTDTTPGNCKVLQYPATPAGTGTVAGNTISITVPLATGFGRPIHGTTLYNVTGFTFGRNNDTTDLYADVDASAPFDVRVR